MTYILQKYPHHYDILHFIADCVVARIHLLDGGSEPHFVSDDQGRYIFAVRRVEDAIPTFERYYLQHQPRWQFYPERGETRLAIRRTPYGELRLEETHDGRWTVFRGGKSLLHKEKVAIFETCWEAQQAAEAHKCDYFYRVPCIGDGFHWPYDCLLDWSNNVDRVLERVARTPRNGNGRPLHLSISSP